MCLAHKLDVKKLIEEEIELSDFLHAKAEVTKENAKIFIRVLQKHMDVPSSKEIRDTVLENIQILNKAMDVLIGNKNLVYVAEDIKSLFSILQVMEDYFQKFGLKREVGKALRKSYLKVNDYLDSLREPLYVEKDMNDPNIVYLDSYKKYLSTNIERVRKGLNPLDKPKQWNIDTNCDKGEIETLALSDSTRTLRSGVDMSERRGDLRFTFGHMSRGELSDEIIGSVANQMLQKTRKKLVQKIMRLENIKQFELSTKTETLAHAIVERARKNRGR